MSPLGTTVGTGVGQAKHSITPSSAALPQQAPGGARQQTPGLPPLARPAPGRWFSELLPSGPLHRTPARNPSLLRSSGTGALLGKGPGCVCVCARRAPRARAGPLAPRCGSSAETRRGGKKSGRGSARRPRPGVPATAAPKTCGRSRLGRTGRGFPRQSGRGCVDAALHQP